MAIITKGSNLEKGNEVEFTLNITDLLVHASVSGDAYFSVQSNWDKVFLNYTSAGYQKEILIFNNVDSGTSSAANFGVFSDARDLFEVHSIIIMDKQGGYLKIKRSDLVVADFDILLAAVTNTSNATFTINDVADTVLTNGNLTVEQTSAPTSYAKAFLTPFALESSGESFYAEFNVDNVSTLTAFGGTWSTTDPSTDGGGVTMGGGLARLTVQDGVVYIGSGGTAFSVGSIGQISNNDVVGVKIDTSAKTVAVHKNGVWISDADYTAALGEGVTRFYFGVGLHAIGDKWTKVSSPTYTPSGIDNIL